MSENFFFDPSKEEGSHFNLIRPGNYVAEIIEAEIKQPQSGDGHMLAITWRISEGDYEGRQIWESRASNTAKSRRRPSRGAS
jgi:Protein of unknown function (DUF669)